MFTLERHKGGLVVGNDPQPLETKTACGGGGDEGYGELEEFAAYCVIL